MDSYADYTSQLPRFKFDNFAMDTIGEDSESNVEIDLEFTDADSESYYSETESDKAFVVPDGNLDHVDPTYEPGETESSSGSDWSDGSDIQNFEILDKREVDGPRSKYTEYRVCLWVEERHLNTLLSLERLAAEGFDSVTHLMDPTTIYASTAGGLVFGTLFKHLTYPFLLQRHRLAGPWTRAAVLMYLLYAAINLFCISFRAVSSSEIARRAGNLSLSNLIISFGSGSFDCCTDVFGVPRRVCQQAHRATAWMVTILLAIHITASLPANPQYFRVDTQDSLSGWIGAVLVAGIVLVSMPYLRHHAYEVSFRTHQTLAVALLYAIWQHLTSTAQLPRLYVIMALVLPTLGLVYDSTMTLFRNGIIPFRGRTAMVLSHGRSGAANRGAGILRIALPRPTKVEPGQHVGVWMPTVSFWSWAQIHPYMVVSWEHGPVDELDVFIQAHRGFSGKLLQHAPVGSMRAVSFPGLIIGPHGISKNLNRYERVLAITSDSGIASVVSHVKRLISSHANPESRARSVHLVWQLDQAGRFITSTGVRN
ncbi:conserved hypothetical protein [Talaromyces stipitatus ATCC 10500]|uniref:FAD-binding FR-type domain-containing protein n=1 Tax=Talaromyces stipitatus (strain ATCC 10500 / CBS 375.48 / QM 6759 / NRRL 1006) TaxID=441959 RepID=B8LX69_TALSN|nr:uncharacterized protein TSTA_062070 [Talaromyces stipitatus ATCC 10500]EED22719.1 conserved hypothetical protein [Talaromyces stipitatus ATCC 10500]